MSKRVLGAYRWHGLYNGKEYSARYALNTEIPIAIGAVGRDCDSGVYFTEYVLGMPSNSFNSFEEAAKYMDQWLIDRNYILLTAKQEETLKVLL